MSPQAQVQTDAQQEEENAPAVRTVAVMGGSGYVGGELLRYLCGHPGFEVVAATSRRNAGEPLHRVHPHLRGFLDLRFTQPDALPDADVVMTCLPHGHAADVVPGLLEQGSRVVDLSADFRLGDPERYRDWYAREHPAPELLGERVYGLPEAHREELRRARLVSGVGCVATSVNLALLPLARAGLLEDARVVADAKIGSSAAGSEPSAAGMHAERSRTIRLYAPTSHRHAAEVEQETGALPHMSVHAVELVRGALATCHVLLPEDSGAPSTKELWKAWRTSYNTEPFVRLVKERRGVHRGPDPRLVAGTNLADVGFHVEQRPDRDPGRIVATCAIDNLGKGAAGSAVQSLNLMMGLDETQGLRLVPAHPV